MPGPEPMTEGVLRARLAERRPGVVLLEYRPRERSVFACTRCGRRFEKGHVAAIRKGVRPFCTGCNMTEWGHLKCIASRTGLSREDVLGDVPGALASLRAMEGATEESKRNAHLAAAWLRENYSSTSTSPAGSPSPP